MKKALVVDDTKNIRTLLTTCLEMNNYEVITAKDGEEAVNQFKKQKFDIAFLDIKMPEISGTEVLRQIRSLDINTPVIIMTAFATVKNAVDCTKLGSVAYLQKPFTSEKIKSLLNEIEKDETLITDISNYISYSKKLIKENKEEEALKFLNKALALKADDGQIYYLIAVCYKHMGKEEEAKKFYKASQVFDYKLYKEN